MSGCGESGEKLHLDGLGTTQLKSKWDALGEAQDGKGSANDQLHSELAPFLLNPIEPF
jgi:hypothetical protein